MILRAFQGVAIVGFSSNGMTSFQMTALNDIQKTILSLLKTPDIYSEFANILKSTSGLRET
jgi:hypothetical protein